MVVSLSTGHADDWEWKAVQTQMEDLRLQGYITKLKQDAAGATYWTITESGKRYLRSLIDFEDEHAIQHLYAETTPVSEGAVMTTVGGWEQLKPLGEGGQSRVFLVRSSARAAERKATIQQVLRSNPWAPYIGSNPSEVTERVERLASSIWTYGRPDTPADLGALKIFKIPEDETEAAEALGRLKNEITVLRQKRPGLVKLLDVNEQEKWIVTEFMPLGTLDKNPALYKGNAFGALKAFRSLVTTVAGLHKDKYVHRDIKPANVFLAENGDLVLGDFGIVFLPEQADRLTLTDERVGPRDYMPQWGDLGQRLENVHTNFDVYMLGKLLWCMVTGCLKLPREYHKKPAFDVKVRFPDDPAMYSIDAVLEKCVVEEPEQCLASAVDLLPLVDEQLAILKFGGQILRDGVPRPCHVCGKGQYKKVGLDPGVTGKPVVGLTMSGKPIEVSMYICDNCEHVEFFRTL